MPHNHPKPSPRPSSSGGGRKGSFSSTESEGGHSLSETLHSEIREETLNIKTCPEFNRIGATLPPNKTIVIPDTHASLTRMLHRLSDIGLVYFDEASWAEILACTRFEDFESGNATERTQRFKDNLVAYQRFKSEQPPWASSGFRAFQESTSHSLPKFRELLRLAIHRATEFRQQNDLPTRKIQLIGDTTCDREGSAGDDYTFIIYELLGEKINESLSNHALGTLNTLEFFGNEFLIEAQIQQEQAGNDFFLASSQLTANLTWILGIAQARPDGLSVNNLIAALRSKGTQFKTDRFNTKALREMIAYAQSLLDNFDKRYNEIVDLIPAESIPDESEPEILRSGLRGILQTIKDSALLIRRQMQALPATASNLYYPSSLTVWAALLPADDNELIDEGGNYTEDFRTRLEEEKRKLQHWRKRLKLIQRAGVDGSFLTHAPGIGSSTGSTEENMIEHYLAPTASIMLDALNENRRNGSTPAIREAAKAQYAELQAAFTKANQVSNKAILKLIEKINASMQFFIANDLFIGEVTTDIPATHIGLLSRAPKAADYESIITNAGRRRQDFEAGNTIIDFWMGGGFGDCSEKEPLICWIYPIGAFMWSRAGGKPERMVYRHAKTQAILLRLHLLEDQIYGHTGVSGGATPYYNGIDDRHRAMQAIIKSRFGVTHATLHWRLLDNTFAPELIKKIIRSINASRATEDTSGTALEDLEAGRTTSLMEILQTFYKELSELHESPAPNISQVRRCRNNFLQAIHSTTEDKALKESIEIFPEYLPDEEAAYNASKLAHEIEKLLGATQKGRFAGYWKALCTLAPTTGVNLLVREIALYFSTETNLTSLFADKLKAKVFYNALKSFTHNAPGASEPSNAQNSVPAWNKVLAGLATVANIACFNASIILLVDIFDSNGVALMVENFVGHIGFFATEIVAVIGLYLLVEFANTEALQKISKCLDCLKPFFPGLSGVLGQPWANFLLTPFLYVFFTTLCYRLGDRASCLPAESNSTNTTTATVVTEPATTTPPIARIFGNRVFRSSYPASIPMLFLGFAKAVCAAYLASKDPSARSLALQTRKTGLHQQFEAPIGSTHVQNTRIAISTWDDWIERPILIACGLFGLTAFFNSTDCSYHRAAMGAAIIAAALLALRFAAYPPKPIDHAVSRLTQRLIPQTTLRTAFLLASSLLTMPSHLYLLTVYFYFCAYSSFGVDAFNQDNPKADGLWLTWAGLAVVYGLGTLYSDALLKAGKLVTSDTHAANRTREEAEAICNPSNASSLRAVTILARRTASDPLLAQEGSNYSSTSPTASTGESETKE